MMDDDPNRPRPITPEQLEQLKAGPYQHLFEGLVAVYLPPFREMSDDERKSADEFWERQMENKPTTKGTTMKFEVMDRESANAAVVMGLEVERWNSDGQWVKYHGTAGSYPAFLYRLAPKKRRVPLADLRALAGAMLVWPDGSYSSIFAIEPDGQAMGVKGVVDFIAVTADQLAKGYHYDRGAGPVPCWTEVEV